jgi:S-adenosylhomocysteine hydrolase
MKLLKAIVDKYTSGRPLEGKTILLCTHAKETTLQLSKSILQLGGNLYVCPVDYSQNLSIITELKSQDGLFFIANFDEIRQIISQVDIIIEDGARISKHLNSANIKHLLKPNIFSIEQTTGGIKYWESEEDMIPYPVVNVAQSSIKLGLENSIATPEAILAAFSSSTEISLTTKSILVIGYGAIGSGLADLCRIHGAKVTVIELDPVRQLMSEARGFATFPPNEINNLISEQQIIISCTSNVIIHTPPLVSEAKSSD